PPAGSANHMRRLAHGFHATSENDRGLAKLNQLSGRDDGLDSRTAQPVNRESGDFNGKTCSERHMTSSVDGVGAGLHRVSKDRVIETAGLKSGLRDGGLRSDPA